MPTGAWQPPGWRAAGPEWHTANRRAERRRQAWGVLGGLLALAVVLAALFPSKVLSWLPGVGGSEGPSEPTRLPPETAAPTEALPDERFPDAPTLDAPFRGSPAERYADGADGIELPEAEPVGDMSAKQVAFALRKTKEFLVDANLDPTTLRGGRPETALGLLDPMDTEFLDLLDTSLRQPDKDHDPVDLFTRFDPDEVRLVGDVVRTRGRMTFAQGESGSVEVSADYTFVYPLVKAHEGADEVERTIVRRLLVVQMYNPAKWEAIPGKLTVVGYAYDAGNVACFVYDGYFHPEFDSDRPTPLPPDAPTRDPYDRSEEFHGGTGEEECRAISRT